MATDVHNTTNNSFFKLHRAQIFGVLAVLAPLSYFAGRLSLSFLADTYLSVLSTGIVAGALGVMGGIPLGLFFGSLRPQAGKPTAASNSLQMQRSILQQVRAELSENRSLFEARKGSTTLYARIDYIDSFWETIKASGRLFVVQDPQVLSSIGSAYYWLSQATHLEKLAYDAKNTGDQATADKLIREVRLLDGQLSNALNSALGTLNSVLGA